MKKIIFATLFSSAIIASIYDAFANSNGQGGATAAPGELTCSQASCHGSGNGEGSLAGLADNTGGGSISISGLTGTYVPGQLYHLTVHIAQTGGTTFGFNLEALDASYGSAGTFTVTQAGTQLRTGVAGTRNGITMGHAGSTGTIAGMNPDFFDFTFDWTAPTSSVGPVTFYTAGIAANSSSLQDSGDQVYSTSLAIAPTVAPASMILISRTTLSNPSFSALANTVGTINDFYVAGKTLSGNLTVAVTGAQFNVSTSNSGPWLSSIPLTATSGSVAGTRIFVRYSGAASGTQTGSITISGGGATQKTIALSGVVRTPTISVPAPASLNFGTVNVGSGTSATQTFTYTPANPVNDYILTCPTGYEISFVPTRDFQSVITLKYFGFAFAPTVYVRLKNPQIAGSINGNLTIATQGATTQQLALSATAVNPAQYVLASTDYLNLFTTNPLAASANQTFTVHGAGLTSTMNIDAAAPFEVSTSPTSGFNTSITINPTGGTVANTTIYVRYNPTVAYLDFGSITVSSTGCIDQNININGDCFGSPAASINDISKNEKISIYPNPATSVINMKGVPAKSTIKVYDISGKLVLEKDATQTNVSADNILTLNVNGLPAGVYTVITENNKNRISNKVVISK
jgi:hypothetical protein